MTVEFNNIKDAKLPNPTELEVGQGILFNGTGNCMVRFDDDLWVVFTSHEGVKTVYTKSQLGSTASWASNRRLLTDGDSITLRF